MASIVERLTENIVERNLLREGAALSKKWERTGLLEGIDSDVTKTTMARLLENQAKELLREASTMSAGDVEGFAAVAFPIVRRVFGGLIANELVAVQPMSLPSGLIFFLDFTYTNTRFDVLGESSGVGQQSVYGGGKIASQITGGISLTGANAEASFYALNNGYASPSGSVEVTENNAVTANPTGLGDNEITDELDGTVTALLGNTGTAISALSAGQKKALRYDADVLSSTSTDRVGVLVLKLTAANMALINLENLLPAVIYNGTAVDTLGGNSARILRRLTERGYRNTSGDIVAGSDALFISLYVQGNSSANFEVQAASPLLKFAAKDAFSAGTGLGSVAADQLFFEGSGNGSSFTANNGSVGAQDTTIPEIDIKVDSIAVTAVTKKLKAKWSPELGQDLNAYHNLDAEVELTSILSEHVALEIDQEILNDLVKGATAGVKYWSRRPGQFVNRDTGAAITSVGAPPDFTGNVSMWYETLVETINDVSAQIHRKTLRGGANFLVTSPEVANLLEFTSGFRADINMEELKGGSVGAVKAGSISKKWDVYVDPYFPRNLILVGRRGKAFLESGYVYAPYVPLMITPTIFGTEDFVPRKGLMTRYAKKMVRPDMFGLVICQDLIG